MTFLPPVATTPNLLVFLKNNRGQMGQQYQIELVPPQEATRQLAMLRVDYGTPQANGSSQVTKFNCPSKSSSADL